MKRVIFTYIISFLYILASAQESLPSWQEGYMDIHTIATGKGESLFIVMPDGTTMVIDAGDTRNGRMICEAYPDDSKSPAEWISVYIDHFSPHGKAKVDYFWLTHFHTDHFGNVNAMKPGERYGLSGIMELGEYVDFGKIIDRGYPDYDFPSRNLIVEKSGGAIRDYLAFIEYKKGCGTEIERFNVGVADQFVLKHNPEKFKDLFRIKNLACNGEIAQGNKTVKMYKGDPETSTDENMLSGAVLIEYGPFRYYTGGDIIGSCYGPASGAADARDFETPIADIIGKVHVMKANHHAWKDALNPYFLWVTRPDAIIVPSYHINHPWRETVDRVRDPQMPGEGIMFLTSDAARGQLGEERWKKFPPFGHIVVRVFNEGRSYCIFVLDPKSKDYKIIYDTKTINLN